MTHSLLDLPPEIRLLVYEHFFIIDLKELPNKDSAPASEHLSLLLTCRAIYSECRKPAFSNTTFNLQLRCKQSLHKLRARFDLLSENIIAKFHFLSLELGQHVRSITLHNELDVDGKQRMHDVFRAFGRFLPCLEFIGLTTHHSLRVWAAEIAIEVPRLRVLAIVLKRLPGPHQNQSAFWRHSEADIKRTNHHIRREELMGPEIPVEKLDMIFLNPESVVFAMKFRGRTETDIVSLYEKKRKETNSRCVHVVYLRTHCFGDALDRVIEPCKDHVIIQSLQI